MKKDMVIKVTLLVILVAVISSTLTSLVITNSLSGNKILGSVSHSDYLDSSNVTYLNSNVQDSIDNLYTQANDYSSINNRLENVEGYLNGATSNIQEQINIINNSNNLKTYTATNMYNVPSIGISSTTTFDEIVKTKLPVDSILSLWINQNSTYGSEIRSDLSSNFNSNFYGICKFEKISASSGGLYYMVSITCRHYYSNQIFINTYSYINSGTTDRYSGWSKISIE